MRAATPRKPRLRFPNDATDGERERRGSLIGRSGPAGL